MKIQRGFLRSRVARRIVALFVLCALVPIIATAVLSRDHVRRLLFDRSYLHLAQLGQAYSQSLYERLSIVQSLLGMVAPDTGSGSRAGAERRNENLLGRVDALALVRPDGSTAGLAGTPRPFAALSDAEWKYLSTGKSILRIRTNSGAPATVILARAIDARDSSAGVVVAELNAEYFWGEADVLPAVTDFSVIGAGGEPLFSSKKRPGPLLAALAQRQPPSPNGRMVYDATEGAELAGYRELFLRANFYLSGWTVVATRPEVEVLAPIAAFEQSLLLAIVLALLGIVLVSVWQIRRTLVPLEGLLEGTRRAANKDFSTRVEVLSHDEFGELAQSFNTMISRLGRQFTALSTLSAIDRTILSRPDVVQVIEAVLRRIRAIVPAQCASIVINDRHTAGTMRLYTRGHSDATTIDRTRVAGTVDDLRLLGNKSEGTWLSPAAATMPCAASLVNLGAAALFAVPITWQGEVIGAVFIGTSRMSVLDDDEEARIRDLADRVGVAYAAASKDEQLYYQAHYDPLTQLPNRLYFRDQLERSIIRAERNQAEFAVLFVDLDFFKHVNDSMGHAAGDEVLVEAGARLRHCVRSTDIVGRLGGDEFTILITDVKGGGDSRVVAQNVIAAMSKPFLSAGQQYYLSASVGIAVYPADGATAEELLRNADTAMYRAKESGRSRSVYFEEKMNSAALARVRSERDLRHALEHREFYVVYQPMLDLHTGKLSGAEALLRWNHPEHGALAPTAFIQLAEETGLIDQLGEWVLHEACTELHALQTRGLQLPKISVNVSARQFKQPNFVETVRKVLRKTGVPGTSLELEITESLLLDATPQIGRTMAALGADGVRFALDDFGTGYSSLAYLKRFPVDVVKIDRAFIKDLPADRSSAAITEAIISMAHALQKQVVAEGVATAEQLMFLRDLGCDEVQGFHLAKPLRAAELAAFVHRAQGVTDGQVVAAPESRRAVLTAVANKAR